MADLLNKLLRAGEGKALRRLEHTIDDVNVLEEEFAALSDDELRGKTAEFRARLEEDWELDDLLPEAFAAVREASKRTIGLRPFDVQLLGGAVLHEGSIAEMRTGEGKTLVATLPLYLNALPAKGVHLVTVNDYLARRDAEWMRPIYEALGLTVGVIQADLEPEVRRAQYECDITYGTNSEFGFDYLRDNLAQDIEQCVQRGYAYAIVDEVDSILIDEARTPLIISGQPEEAPDTYYTFAKIARTLSAPDDFEIDEKRKTVAPSEQGVHKVENALKIENLYSPENGQLVNHLVQALKAESLYKRDVEYVVLDGEVKIIDEFTGRIMEGRRWSEGLHQAVEAKENVKIEAENVTVATITIQNYFRLYEKLSGMTGTALTEATEFGEIYKLSVVPIPTNQPMMRLDKNDFIYKTRDEKFNAVINDIAERHEKGQPVLVGTISVEVSEYLSGLLEQHKIPHNVLNAKQHEREAEVIVDAGHIGAVTIATNMAGRGVDIKLQDGVRELGGLYILGTERHESRRIDNQLRGRSGRQGDPGESRFFLSAEDDLVRLFAGDRIYSILDKLGPAEGEPIEHKMLTKRIEGAQKKVEEQNFEIRKNVLKYDDVLNHQRGVIYAERREVLEGNDMREEVLEWVDEVLEGAVVSYTDSQFPEEWDLEAMFVGLAAIYPISFGPADRGPRPDIEREELIDRVLADARRQYEAKEQAYSSDERIGPDVMRQLERFIVLNAIDQRWREHLDNMDYLREGIHLRSMAQKDPLVEYRVEGHQMFQEMMDQVKTEVCSFLFHAEIAVEDDLVPLGAANQGGQLTYQHGDHSALEDAREFAPGGSSSSSSTTITQARAGGGVSQTPIVQQHRATDEPGRNDPCPCGSGKKYKRCHGAQAVSE
jgi:preprotein translocase subunit SecA